MNIQHMTLNDFNYFNQLTDDLYSNFNNEDESEKDYLNNYFHDNVEEDLNDMHYTQEAIDEIKTTFFKF